VVQAYAERGELAHPRFERGERAVSDLPELPAAYAESTPFISAAAAAGAPPIVVDDSDFGLDLAAADTAAEPAPAAAPRPRRSLGGRGKSR
jgi:HemY protein